MDVSRLVSRVGFTLGVMGIDGVSVVDGSTLEANGAKFSFWDKSTAKTPRADVLGKTYICRDPQKAANDIAGDIVIELAKREVAKNRAKAVELLNSLCARMAVGLPSGLTVSVVGTELVVTFKVPDLKLTARALRALKGLVELDALAKEQAKAVHKDCNTLLPEPLPTAGI